MKFTALQQDLLPPLQAAARSAGAKSALPVLDNLLLEVEGDRLKIAATNLEIGVIRYVHVEADSAGSVTVPARTLVELVAGLGAGKVSVGLTGELLGVESGKLKASVNTIPAAEFPVIPLSSDQGVTFPKEAFLTSAQVLFAAAVDEGRPVLTGILTEVADGKLDFVATDGFRLAHRRVDLADSKLQFKSLIPRRTFEEVLRTVSEEEAEEVTIASSENQNQVVFVLGKATVSSRLIEGQFPAWSRIIPQKIVARAMVEKEELLKAIKLAAIFARNEAHVVVITAKKGGLKLQSHAKEIGSQENEVEGDVEGEELQIAFNSKFLLDALSNTPSAQAMIEFSGSLSAVLIKPVGVAGLEYIVMPVRLS